MKIEVNEKCSGHGRCYMLAPEVFEADDEGYNVAIGRTIDVPSHLEDAARIGVANCPEGALVVLDS